MNLRLNGLKLTSPDLLFKNPSNQNNTNNDKPVKSVLSGLKIKNDSTSFSSVANTPKSINTIINLTGLNNTNIGTTQNTSSKKISGIPPRNPNALTGSQFIEATKNLNRQDRENMTLKEVSQGNIPDSLRNLKQVNISITDSNGNKHNAKISVIPDYIAIGSNDDYVRIPMNPITAQKIADKTGMILPTKKIVDEIYKSSDIKMSPQPLPAGPNMMSNEYYKKHNDMVQSQLTTKGDSNNKLISGHQKDVVITNRLDNKPKQVAIYGWHQNNGKPIQPLSTVHENTYADYSHGVRLVSSNIIVDGKQMNIKDVLKDPVLSKLLSDEGVINNSDAIR